MKDAIESIGHKLYKGKKSLAEIVSGAKKQSKLISEPKMAQMRRAMTIAVGGSNRQSPPTSKTKKEPNLANDIDREIEDALQKLDKK